MHTLGFGSGVFTEQRDLRPRFGGCVCRDEEGVLRCEGGRSGQFRKNEDELTVSFGICFISADRNVFLKEAFSVSEVVSGSSFFSLQSSRFLFWVGWRLCVCVFVPFFLFRISFQGKTKRFCTDFLLAFIISGFWFPGSSRPFGVRRRVVRQTIV